MKISLVLNDRELKFIIKFVNKQITNKMMKNAILACLVVLFGIVMASDSAIETQLRTLTAEDQEFRMLQDPVETETIEEDSGDTTGAGDSLEGEGEVKEDIPIPWDAWLSWGIGGFLVIFIIGSVIWRVILPRCCK